MKAFYASLPSEKMMKELCHGNPDQWLLAQAGSLFLAFSLALIVLYSIPAGLGACLSFIMDRSLSGNSWASFLEWLQSTVTFAVVTAGTIVGLAIFVKTYLRSQFGPPSYISEMQADLSQDSVMAICQSYMHDHCLDQTSQIEASRGRLIGLMYESRNSSTFLEITTLALDPEITWIVVRSATLVVGRAALLDSFYVDFGASREATNKMIEEFSPYASRRKRRLQSSRSSMQAMPALKPVDCNPPPLSPHAHKQGWRLNAR